MRQFDGLEAVTMNRPWARTGLDRVQPARQSAGVTQVMRHR